MTQLAAVVLALGVLACGNKDSCSGPAATKEIAEEAVALCQKVTGS